MAVSMDRSIGEWLYYNFAALYSGLYSTEIEFYFLKTKIAL